MDNIQQLREFNRKYPEFCFDNYDWEYSGQSLQIFCYYSTGDLKFTHKIVIHLPRPDWATDSNIDTFVFQIGLVELLSYWKSTISPKIIIKAGNLTNKQLEWWSKLQKFGMSQYFFENHLPHDSSTWVNFGKKEHKLVNFFSNNKVLVPIGGGKDSAVTAKLLQSSGIEIQTVTVNNSPASNKIVAQLGITSNVKVTRSIDSQILTLNSRGYYNGHVPFSASLAFIFSLVAYLCGFSNIAISNEASSDESNTEENGTVINHQYSKSSAFEQDFQKYLAQYISRDIIYASFLRPLLEFQITGIFARYKDLFGNFLSCNIGQQQDKWCHSCPKCMSIFILLTPFIGIDQVTKIMGSNMLQDSNLEPLISSMLDKSKVRPFECIGTRNESIAAMYLISKKNSDKTLKLVDYFVREILPDYQDHIDELVNSTLHFYGTTYAPQNWSDILTKSLPIVI